MVSLKIEVEKYLKLASKDNLFTGSAVGWSQLANNGKSSKFFAYEGYSDNSEFKTDVTKDILFDLASLTKPLVTVLCILTLINDGLIDWLDDLSSLLSVGVDKDKEKISIINLLGHSSGLPAHIAFYNTIKNKDYYLVRKEIIKRILAIGLEYNPGSKTIYSDLGYMLLGHIIEEKSGETLDEFWQRRIADKLGLASKLQFLKNGTIGPLACVATSLDSFSKKPVAGIVNDDNCRIMGGISGHAGLFGTLEGVLSICESILKHYKEMEIFPAYHNSLLKKAITTRGNSTWVCGFDTPSVNNSVAGQYVSPKSFGHLGYTGTSFWIDIEKSVVIVILTNRTYTNTPKEKINLLRTDIHNLIMRNICYC